MKWKSSLAMMLLLCGFVLIVYVMTVCVMMLLRYDVRESSQPSLFSRPSCTVAESTSGLAAVCPASESVSVISPVVSPAQPSSCPVASRATSVKFQVTAKSATPPLARPVATRFCQVAAPPVASSFPSVRPVVDSPFHLSSMQFRCFAFSVLSSVFCFGSFRGFASCVGSLSVCFRSILNFCLRFVDF